MSKRSTIGSVINWLIGPAIAIILLLLFAAWMLPGDNNETETENAQNDEPRKSLIAKVQVTPSVARTAQQTLQINGITQANRTVSLRSETSGKVLELLKQQGDTVKAGEIIAQLDLKDIPARIIEAEASVTQMRLEYEGAQRLVARGLQNEAISASALANYERAKAALSSLQLTKADATLRAPFDGRIETLDIELGSFVQMGSTVAQIVDFSALKFSGQVAENDIGSISLGQTGTVKLINNVEADASVTYISSIANTATRTFTVEMTIPSVNTTISGVTSVATINTASVDAHYVSPSLLFISDEGELGLKTLNADNTVGFYPVDIVDSTTDGIWVDGLPNEVSIITVGQGFVSVGDTVEAKNRAFDPNTAIGL